jgi:hypothetical protein
LELGRLRRHVALPDLYVMFLTQAIQGVACEAAGDEDAGHSGRFLRVARG